MATITQPTTGTTYSGGSVITFAGSGTDTEDGALPLSGLSWQIEFHHDATVDVVFGPTSGIAGSTYPIPTTGNFSTNVFYRVKLTATDSELLTGTAQVDINPVIANLTLASSPTGLTLGLDAQQNTAPAVISGVAGMTRQISALAQSLAGTSYNFSSWSDFGTATHNITFPSTNTTLTATFSVVPTVSKAGWTLVLVDSAETIDESDVGANAFDGNPNTMWHTQYTGGNPGHPHEIQIDLGSTINVTGFRYLPRQDGSVNARIKGYQFYVSSSSANFGSPVAEGEFPNNANEQEILFPQVSGRYVRLVSLSAHGNQAWASVAELSVLQNVPGNIAPNGTISTPASNQTVEMGTLVTFSGTATDNNSSDPNAWNGPLTYLWTFGSNSGITNRTTLSPGPVRFNFPGVHTVTFRVADAFGLVDPTPATLTITVQQSAAATYIPHDDWVVTSVDSQQSGEGAANVFDNNPNTIWHSQYSPAAPFPPHDLRLDLGATYTISGFSYLPRQDGVPNGNIAQYEFYVSLDGVTWGTPVATGTFPNSSTEQEVFFPAQSARYVRLRALTEVNEQQFTAVAELNVIRPGTTANQAPNGTITLPAADPTIVAGGALDLAGVGTDPENHFPLFYRWTVLPASGVTDVIGANPGLVRFNVPGTYEVTFMVTDARGLTDPTPDTRSVTVLGATDAIAKTGWSLHFVDSEETVQEAAGGIKAFDDDLNTIWHTKYFNVNPIPRLPHEIQIDLGAGHDIGGFRYVPRNDGFSFGRIGDYRFYVSADGTNWGSPVAAGTFLNNGNAQDVRFPAKIGRYIRLRSLTDLGGGQFTSAAEIGAFDAPVLTPSVRIVDPVSGHLQVSPQLYVLALASLDPGQGIRFWLDGGPGSGGAEFVDYQAPYETVFTTNDLNAHTIEAQVVAANGTAVSGIQTRDRVTEVGKGDYYVAIGDSITYGVGDDIPGDNVSADGSNTRGGYTPILADLLRTAAGRRTVVANEGIPGFKAINAAERMSLVLQRHRGARRVIVMLGNNDTSAPVLPSGLGLQPTSVGYAGSFKALVQGIIDDVKATGKTTILAKMPAILPTGGTRDLILQDYNSVLTELVAIPANNIPIAPVDLHTPMTTSAGTVYSDDVHPNGLGYQLIANTMFSALSTPASATVNLSGLSYTYDGSPKSPTATTSPAGLAVAFTFNGSATVPTNAGSYTVVATISDFAYSGTANGTMTISAAGATVTLSNLTQTYSGTPKSATATTAPVGLPVTITYDGSTTAPTAAGTYAVAATISNTNYLGSANGTLTISKAAATVTLSGLAQTFDGSPKTVGATTSPGGLTMQITYNGSTTAPSAVGSYAVVATIVDANYAGSASGTLVITGGAATVTLSTLTHTFDGAAKAATVTTVPAGLPATITYNGSTTAPTAAGTYAVVATVNTGGYTGSANGTLSIAKAAATVTLSGLAQTFDGSPKSVGATTSPAGLTVQFTYDGSATAPTAAGSYAVVATIVEANYAGSANGTLVVATGTAPVTLSNLTHTFNGTAKAATATTVPAGLPVTITYDGATTAPTAAGTYAVVATVNSANYTGSASGSLSIAKAGATITLAGLAQTYDGNPKSVGATTSPAGLTVQITYNGSGTAPTGAGSYAVVATIVDANYAGSANGTLVIANGAATVTLSNLTHTFNGAAKAATAATVPAGLPVTITYNGASTAPTAAGTYAVVATVNTANYSGSANGSLSISKAGATITLSGLAQTFDGSPKSVGITTSPAGLTVQTTYNGSATVPTASGSYAVAATITDGNYTGSTSGTLTINNASSALTLSNLAQAFDGTNKSVGVTTSPVGLSVLITYNGSATPPSAAGSYAVEAVIQDANHVGSASGTFVIYVTPSVSQQPAGRAAPAGSNVSFSVTAAGSPAPAFQWRLNGSDIPGATSSTYTITNVQQAHAGDYRVVVSNVGGSVTSNVANLQVFAPIVISGQPTGSSIPNGSSATLTVTASGPSLTYQWYLGASGDISLPISGANASTYVTPALNAPATYWVRVSSPAQDVASSAATVTVTDSTRIFFGSLGSGQTGTFGLIVRKNNSAQFFADMPGTDVCLVSPEFVVAGNGSFTFSAPGIGTFNGQISGNAVTGTVTGASLAFSGTQENPFGVTSGLAGLYQASILNSSNGQVTILAGADGRAFVVTILGANRFGVLTTITANGVVAVSNPDGSIEFMTVNASTNGVSGTMASAGSVLSINGAREEVPLVKRLDNVSMRGEVQTGDAIMIAGFVVSGSGQKRVLIRGIGPALSQFNVPGALSDAKIELYRTDGGTVLIAQNDDWGQAPNANDIFFAGRALLAFDLAVGSKDAALLVDLPAGNYTAHVRGTNNQTGRALVEVYDADTLTTTTPGARLGNISMRGNAGVGNDVVIAGFVVAGNAPKRVLVRAVGPELAAFNVPGALTDPVLEVFQSTGGTSTKISENNNWGTDAAVVAEAGSSVNAFPLTQGSASAAKVMWLAPGTYTAHASSGNGTTGIALVEVYELP